MDVSESSAASAFKDRDAEVCKVNNEVLVINPQQMNGQYAVNGDVAHVVNEEEMDELLPDNSDIRTSSDDVMVVLDEDDHLSRVPRASEGACEEPSLEDGGEPKAVMDQEPRFTSEEASGQRSSSSTEVGERSREENAENQACSSDSLVPHQNEGTTFEEPERCAKASRESSNPEAQATVNHGSDAGVPPCVADSSEAGNVDNQAPETSLNGDNPRVEADTEMVRADSSVCEVTSNQRGESPAGVVEGQGSVDESLDAQVLSNEVESALESDVASRCQNREVLGASSRADHAATQEAEIEASKADAAESPVQGLLGDNVEEGAGESERMQMLQNYTQGSDESNEVADGDESSEVSEAGLGRPHELPHGSLEGLGPGGSGTGKDGVHPSVGGSSKESESAAVTDALPAEGALVIDAVTKSPDQQPEAQNEPSSKESELQTREESMDVDDRSTVQLSGSSKDDMLTDEAQRGTGKKVPRASPPSAGTQPAAASPSGADVASISASEADVVMIEDGVDLDSVRTTPELSIDSAQSISLDEFNSPSYQADSNPSSCKRPPEESSTQVAKAAVNKRKRTEPRHIVVKPIHPHGSSLMRLLKETPVGSEGSAAVTSTASAPPPASEVAPLVIAPCSNGVVDLTGDNLPEPVASQAPRVTYMQPYPVGIGASLNPPVQRNSSVTTASHVRSTAPTLQIISSSTTQPVIHLNGSMACGTRFILAPVNSGGSTLVPISLSAVKTVPSSGIQIHSVSTPSSVSSVATAVVAAQNQGILSKSQTLACYLKGTVVSLAGLSTSVQSMQSKVSNSEVVVTPAHQSSPTVRVMAASVSNDARKKPCGSDQSVCYSFPNMFKPSVIMKVIFTMAHENLLCLKRPLCKKTLAQAPDNLFLSHRSLLTCNICQTSFCAYGGFQDHLSRKSMLLKFCCPGCRESFQCTNKCALLYALASHACFSDHPSKDVDLRLLKVSSLPLHLLDSLSQSTPCMSQPSSVEVRPPCSVAPSCSPPPSAACPKEDEAPGTMPPAKEMDLQHDVAHLKKLLSRLLRCQECGQPSRANIGLRNHFTKCGRSSQQPLLPCNKCTSLLPTRCAFNAHLRIHDKQEPYVCPECGEHTFATREIFMKHVKMGCLHFNRQIQWRCSFCTELFHMQSSLVQHICSAHIDSYFKCRACPMAFKTKANYTKHAEEKHAGGQGRGFMMIGKCPVCNKLLKSSEKFGQVHMRQHIELNYMHYGAYVFSCLTCNVYFPSKQVLIKHMSMVHPNLVLKKKLCWYCGWEAKNYDSLLNHVVLIHQEEVAKLAQQPCCEKCKTIMDQPGQNVCQHCEKEGQVTNGEEDDQEEEEEDVEEESRQDAKEKKDAAEKLDSTAKNSSSHHGWEYECTQCQVMFESEQIYLRHMAKHRFIKKKLRDSSSPKSSEPQRPVRKRAVVGSISPQPQVNSSCPGDGSQLEPPKPVGLAEPFHCGDCEHVFEHLDQLDEHRRMSHNEQPQYPCHLCGTTYSNQDELSTHLKRAHEGKARTDMFVCHLCLEKNVRRSFVMQAHLIAHLRIHKVHKRRIKEIISKSVCVASAEECKVEMKEESGEEPACKRLRLDGEAIYQCAKCSFSSEDRQAFTSHIVRHRMSRSALQCRECGLCFAVAPALKRHLFMVHKIRKMDGYEELEVNSQHESGPKECSVVLIRDVKKTKEDKNARMNAAGVNDDGKKKELKVSVPENQCSVCHKICENSLALAKHIRNHGMAFIQSKRMREKMAAKP